MREGASLGRSGYFVSEVPPGSQGVPAHRAPADRPAARADGQDDLFLLVSDFNLPAQRFYAANGYHQVGAIAGYVCPGIGELIYRKRLRESTP